MAFFGFWEKKMQQLGGCCVIEGRMVAGSTVRKGPYGGQFVGNVGSGRSFGPVLAL